MGIKRLTTLREDWEREGRNLRNFTLGHNSFRRER